MSDYNSKVIRKYVNVTGRVQGVGFRYRARYAALMLGVTGWVRNEPDGSVSMELQGTEEQIDQVIIMVSRGTYIDIQDIHAKDIPLSDSDYGFGVRD